MPNIHTASQVVPLIVHLTAASRTTTGGISGGATYAGSGIDLTLYYGDLCATVIAGTVGTSLDGKWQESDDNTTFTDIAGVSAMTQLTAAGNGTCDLHVRKATKRYVRFLNTLGGTCVFAVAIQETSRKI